VAVACAYRPAEFVGVLAPFGLAAGVLWLVGIRDDIKPLSARSKLVCQIGITFLIVQSGCYPENVAMLGYHLHLGWFGAVCMMGWLVLGINALNLIDGMDGLASVTGIVISTGIAVVAGIQGDLPTLVLALALAGGLAGFLVHNLPPATIFLGDSGSMVVGLALSFLAFRLTTDVSATIHVTSLTLLLFVPLLDTHLAVARRLLMGRNIFHGDHSHLHHQLLGKGLTVWKTLGLLGVFSGVSVAAACLAAITGRELAAWAMVLGSTGLLVAGRYVGVQELTLVRLALGGEAQRQAEMDLSSDPLSHVPDIIPMDRGLARKPSQARPANADYESAEPSKQRSVA
jgi:UDP-GlcNAc:undecaprenyl-phosphate GlcNAc-1-phosphate transferase